MTKDQWHGVTAHSSYITYVFGRICVTMSASDGKRIATYALGRMISGFILFAFQEVSESPAPSHGDLDFKSADHMYDAGLSRTLQASLSATGIYR